MDAIINDEEHAKYFNDYKDGMSDVKKNKRHRNVDLLHAL